nr:AmmeMemoRadiSam system radical SAM enzyme [uncultured Carboxylicivirga sp.]
MKEALFYISKNGSVRCTLCPHTCVLNNEEVGKCKVRKNRDGKLVSLSYGMISAMHVDLIEKKPLYHFLPGSKAFSISTAGCVLSCLNCQNWQISQRGVDDNKDKFVTPEEIVNLAVEYGCKSIAFTYNDPIVFYEYMLEIAQLAKQKGLMNVLISSGFINVKPLRKLLPFIDAANVDLKCFDNFIYQRLNGARLKPVLNTLQVIKDAGVWLETTNLIIPGYTDNEQMFLEMCQWLVINGFDQNPLHINRFVAAHELSEVNSTSLAVLKKLKKIAINEGLKFVYIGNIRDEKSTTTYCPVCGSRLINHSILTGAVNLTCKGECKYCASRIAGVWL